MIEFFNIHNIYITILLPILILLFWWSRKTYTSNLRKFGGAKVLEHLMPDSSKYVPTIKFSILLIALSLVIIILCRPCVSHKKETTTGSGNEVFIVLDVSNSMLASSSGDQNGTPRLLKAKMLLEKLINTFKDDRVGLIVFAGNAYLQLPMTSDFISAKQYLDIVSTDMAPTQGTAISEALTLAMNSFTVDEDKHKAIILLTDCEDHQGEAVQVATEASKHNIQVDVIGLGTSQGVPIPVNKDRNEFLKNYNGETVKTALNEQLAKDIATAGKGIYVNGNSSSVLSDISSQLGKLSKSELKTVRHDANAELFPIFTLLALILLILDVFILDKKIGWLRNFNFFSK